MALMRRLATLTVAAEAARRYARNNPEQAGRFLDQAAAFVDKQTKGRYRTQIDGAADKVKGIAGITGRPGYDGPVNGSPSVLPPDATLPANPTPPNPAPPTTPPPTTS